MQILHEQRWPGAPTESQVNVPYAHVLPLHKLAHVIFNLRNKGRENHLLLPIAAIAMICLAIVTKPDMGADKSAGTTSHQHVEFSQIKGIIKNRCVSCHSSKPSDDAFTIAPNGVTFDTPEQIKKWKYQIIQRAVSMRNMPLANKTNMTDEEREILGIWAGQKGE